MHLRDADALGDLALREALEEAQVEDVALALVELREARRERRAVLHRVVGLFLAAEVVDEAGVLLAALAVGRGLQRDGVVGLARLERLEHLFGGGVGGLGELVDGRRALQLGDELVDHLVEADVELLQAARHAHRPALVAEVALDLADDVGRRVRRQLDAALEVEAVDRLDEADGADLDEVVEVLAARGVAPRQRPHQREVHGDELLARLAVAVQVVAAQQVLVELVRLVAPAALRVGRALAGTAPLRLSSSSSRGGPARAGP